MKWFKHYSRARSTEPMIALREEFGVAGYGRYYMILEEVAGRSEDDSFVLGLAVREWCTILGLQEKNLRTFLDRLQKLSLLSVEQTENVLRIGVPNLAKWRDEYTRKSGHPPDIVRTLDTENRGQRQKQNPAPPDDLPCGSPERPRSRASETQHLPPPKQEPGRGSGAANAGRKRRGSATELALEWVRNNLEASPAKVQDQLNGDPALALAVQKLGGWSKVQESFRGGILKGQTAFTRAFGQACQELRGERPIAARAS